MRVDEDIVPGEVARAGDGGQAVSPPSKAVSPIVKWIAAVAFCVSLAITCASIVTRTPWSDEGVYADPAVSLVTHGGLGSTVLGEHTVMYLPGVHRYTYWIPPFYEAGVAAAFKVFGVGIVPMRGFSLLCGALALAAWCLIGRRLAANWTVGLLAGAVLALDFAFLNISANGRPDAMVLGFGSAGLAAYLTLRERNLTWALLGGWTLCALSACTHPSGAIFVCDLLLLIGLLDLRRIRPVHAVWALLPFVVLGMVWLSYVMQAPEIFRTQFGNQIRSRTTSNGSRMMATITDFYYRYCGYYYRGMTGYQRLKIVGLLLYVVAFAGVSLSSRLRSRTGVRAALVLAVANYCLLANLDRQQFPHYLVTVFAPLSLVAAIWVGDALENGSTLRWIAGSLLAASFAVSVCGHGVKILANGYKNEFLPVIERVKPITDRGGTIVAGSEIAFGVGFRPNVIDDLGLGADLVEPPEAIVFNIYDLSESKVNLKEVLARYQKVLSSPNFTLYERRNGRR